MTSARGSMPRRLTARRRTSSGDYPEWLDPHLAQTRSATTRAEEGAALASRAPLDLRVNTLKSAT